MRPDDNELQLRDSLAELADAAGGVLAGADATLLSEDDLTSVDIEALRRESDHILDEIGVARSKSRSVTDASVATPLSLADKRAFLQLRLTESAELVMIAARNFEAMPDDTVNTLYEALTEIEHRSGRRA